MQFILLIVSIIAILFVVKILIDSNHEPKLIQVGLSLIIGGALGNLIDRFFTTFNLMNYMEFINDEYFTVQWNHFFKGAIFNKLPLINSPIKVGNNVDYLWYNTQA